MTESNRPAGEIILYQTEDGQTKNALGGAWSHSGGNYRPTRRRATSQYGLDHVERPENMTDWIAKLDDFIKISDRDILIHAGQVSGG